MTGGSEPDVAAVQERAVRYFCDRPGNFPTGRPYNCCESVLLALKGLASEDAEFIPRVGTAIGAGVSLNGLLCGSVSSVAMLIGLKYGRSDPQQSPEPVWRMMDEYVQAFKERFGHLNCRQLTGLNLKPLRGCNSTSPESTTSNARSESDSPWPRAWMPYNGREAVALFHSATGACQAFPFTMRSF